MRILMIATGFPPYLFSENICNGKLALAFLEAGIEVDVISRKDEGPSYGTEWNKPWDALKPNTYTIDYPSGNKIQQSIDLIYSAIKLGTPIIPGIRWARRAYEKALTLFKEHSYTAILTRSPNDISHLVGYKLKKKTGCCWIANWNDPANPIWPDPYKIKYSSLQQKYFLKLTSRLLSNADVNTFPSQSLLNHFSLHFPSLKLNSTNVIPHIGLIESAWPKSSPIPQTGKLRMLHAGNLSKERNPETTFKAMQNLIKNGSRNFEFHIMGNVNDYTEDLIKKYGLNEYVKCIGSKPYMESLSLMQSYDVLVLIEAKLEVGIFFPSKITDYLQAGKPILAISPKEGFASSLFGGREGAYLADNESSHSIVQSLGRTLNDFEEGRLLKMAPRSLYWHLSPIEVVNQYQDILNIKSSII